jgi:hypothetical protein
MKLWVFKRHFSTIFQLYIEEARENTELQTFTFYTYNDFDDV